MPYNINKAGTGVVVIDSVTSKALVSFSQPVFDMRSESMQSRNYSGEMLLIKQGTSTMQIALTDINQINGAAKGADVAAIIAQLNVLSTVASVKPQLSSGGNIQAATHATTGTNYVAFAAQACLQLTIINSTGVDIEVQQDGAGVAVSVFANTAYTFFGLTNANQLGVRRVDTTAVTVNVKARWEA